MSSHGDALWIDKHTPIAYENINQKSIKILIFFCVIWLQNITSLSCWQRETVSNWIFSYFIFSIEFECFIIFILVDILSVDFDVKVKQNKSKNMPRAREKSDTKSSVHTCVK